MEKPALINAIYTEEEKQKLIKKELSRLNKIFKDIPQDKKQLVAGLIESAAYTRASLKELEQLVNKNGYTVQSPQGVKKNPDADMYNIMFKNYQSTIKDLIGYLGHKPKEVSDEMKELDNMTKR